MDAAVDSPDARLSALAVSVQGLAVALSFPTVSLAAGASAVAGLGAERNSDAEGVRASIASSRGALPVAAVPTIQKQDEM